MYIYIYVYLWCFHIFLYTYNIYIIESILYIYNWETRNHHGALELGSETGNGGKSFFLKAQLEAFHKFFKLNWNTYLCHKDFSRDLPGTFVHRLFQGDSEVRNLCRVCCCIALQCIAL